MTEPLRLKLLAREYAEVAQMIGAAARSAAPQAERDRMLAVAAWYGAEGARLEDATEREARAA